MFWNYPLAKSVNQWVPKRLQKKIRHQDRKSILLKALRISTNPRLSTGKQRRQEGRPAIRWNLQSSLLKFSNDHYARKLAFPKIKAICHPFSKIQNVHFWFKFTLLPWYIWSPKSIFPHRSKCFPQSISSLGAACCSASSICCKNKRQNMKNQAVRRQMIFYSWSIYSQFNCIFNANYNTLIFN